MDEVDALAEEVPDRYRALVLLAMDRSGGASSWRYVLID
jgi:hypothetical protein